MGSGSLFNKLWVIESLPKGDLKTVSGTPIQIIRQTIDGPNFW